MSVAGRVVGRALREVDPPRRQERADPVGAGAAVDVPDVVVVGEGPDRWALRRPEELVEHRRPRGLVRDRGARQDTVEIEEAGRDGLRQADRLGGALGIHLQDLPASC